jgi:hypothetical protein
VGHDSDQRPSVSTLIREGRKLSPRGMLNRVKPHRKTTKTKAPMRSIQVVAGLALTQPNEINQFTMLSFPVKCQSWNAPCKLSGGSDNCTKAQTIFLTLHRGKFSSFKVYHQSENPASFPSQLHHINSSSSPKSSSEPSICVPLPDLIHTPCTLLAFVRFFTVISQAAGACPDSTRKSAR